MKKLLTIATVLLTAALVFTGCSNPAASSGGSTPDKGTAPTLETAFWTDNEAWTTYNGDISKFPNRNSELLNSTYDEETDTFSEDHPFRLAISFSDPDLDVEKIEQSWDSSFSKLLSSYQIEQTYEDQIISWNGIRWINITQKNKTLYVRLVDKNGNKSNVISMALTFTNVD